MKIRIHFNKQRAKKGLPWTLHTSKACYAAAHIKVEVPTETEEKPNKPENPRYFLVCNGDIKWVKNIAIIYKKG